MSYYFAKTILASSFDEAIAKTKEAAKLQGFGIVSELDMQNTFKEKLKKDFKRYTIIGACNPQYAYKAIGVENNIGLFLPCNFLVEEVRVGEYTVSAIDPVEMMLAVENQDLILPAYEIREKLQMAIESL